MTAADRDGHAERSATVIVAVNEVGLPARASRRGHAWTLGFEHCERDFLALTGSASRRPRTGAGDGVRTTAQVRLSLPFSRALLSGQKHCYRFRRPSINVDHDGSVFIS